MADVLFRAFHTFNDPSLHSIPGSKSTISTSTMRWFPGDDFYSQVARELASRQAMSIKEVFESLEFYAHVLNHVRTRHVADLFCGHGLVGTLFASLGAEVVLMDRRVPTARHLVLEAVETVTPGSRERIRYERKLPELPSDTTVIAVHGCGPRSDEAIQAAIRCGGDVAVMPCCYPNDAPGPIAVRRALGHELAWDIHRTYQLEAAGYKVRWTAIPPAITPVNRILLARPADS
ncbi:MAG: hypothetical protein ACYCW6_24525 [Candidatus Xenobia bacterium]